MYRTSSGSKSASSAQGFHTIRIRYGFTDEPNILRASRAMPMSAASAST